MRIVVSCCWAPDKGQGISVLSKEIAAGLAKRGHDVFYVSPMTNNLEWYKKTGIKEIFIGNDLPPEVGLITTAKKINQLNPDALINNDHPYVQAALPIINTYKIVISHTMAWGTASLARFNYQWADKIIVISYDMLSLFLRKGVSIEKLFLSMNGIQEPYDKKWMPREYNKTDSLNIFFAGNWTNVKGSNLLLRFIENMPDDISWVKLNIFGTIKAKYQVVIKEKSWIKIHGRVEQEYFLSELEKADCLIFPSKIEGCPMTVIEALSRGVIPIVSDGYGAMRWMVDHGKDGFVARRRYWTQDLKEILEYLNKNRNVLYQMKKNARERYIKQFKIDFMLDNLTEIIENKSDILLFDGPYRAIYWHRPVEDSKSRFYLTLDKILYRFGIIRKGKWVTKEQVLGAGNEKQS